MKVISIQQPWASLIVLGAKAIETRSWSTNYRGPLLIHASAGFPKSNKELCVEEPFRSYLKSLHGLPLGSIIGVASLVEVRSTEFMRHDFAVNRLLHKPYEFQFGDYSPNRYGWVLADVQRLEIPVPAKGQLGLWEYKGPLPDTI